VRAGISLNQELAVPIAERLGKHLASLRIYRGLFLAGSDACARYAVASNVIDVMKNEKVRLIWRHRTLRRAARAAAEHNRSKKKKRVTPSNEIYMEFFRNILRNYSF
jgi:hypothetical protein